MLHLDVLHRQWLLLGLGGGLILMLGVVLVYTAGWRSRLKEREEASRRLSSPHAWVRWGRTTFPWILVVILVGIAIWSFIYPIFKMINPPNW